VNSNQFLYILRTFVEHKFFRHPGIYCPSKRTILSAQCGSGLEKEAENLLIYLGTFNFEK
jgi:hypothetical protein